VGRQALVSSVWWAPLPFLLRIPFAWLLSAFALPLSALAVSALGGAAALLILERVLRKWGVGGIRLLLVFVVGANPAFLAAATDGSSLTVTVCLALVAGYGLAQWVHTRQAGALVYFGLASALLVGSGLDAALWVLIGFVLLLVDVAIKPAEPKQRQAILILGLLPAAYLVALWMLMNWLIMGDALYFLRWMWRPGPVPHGVAVAAASAGIPALSYLAALLSVVAILAGVLRKERAAAWLGVLGVGALTVALFLNSRGLLWPPSAVLALLLPLGVLAIGYLQVPAQSGARPSRGALCVLPVFVTLWALLRVQMGWAGEPVKPALQVRSERELMRKMEPYVLADTEFTKVFVCGYDAFALTGTDEQAVFLPSVDFNANKSKDDYYGHHLYLLVHSPAGRSAKDSIHWKQSRLYYAGSADTLYVPVDWGDWRLFEIIQAARPKPVKAE
jgi:hypothetical protein